jgi:predicted P-loop ATPase/GTPase
MVAWEEWEEWAEWAAWAECPQCEVLIKQWSLMAPTLLFFVRQTDLSLRYLIVGMNAHDSGKTEFSIQLAEALKKSGVEFAYFKPQSGHSYWEKHNHTQDCIRAGKLYSNDVSKLEKVVNSELPLEVLNPIHSLYVPAKLERPAYSIGSTLGIAGWDSILALRRMSQVQDGVVQSMVLIADELINSGDLLISREEADALAGNSERISVSDLEEVYSFETTILEGALNSSFEMVEDKFPIVMIESFNNSAWPWSGLDSVDRVFAVGPGHIFSYEPEKYLKAVSYMQREHTPIYSITLSEIADLLKPKQVTHFRPGGRPRLDALDFGT